MPSADERSSGPGRLIGEVVSDTHTACAKKQRERRTWVRGREVKTTLAPMGLVTCQEWPRQDRFSEVFSQLRRAPAEDWDRQASAAHLNATHVKGLNNGAQAERHGL